ncbi:MAG: PHP domain-containing protein, partial [Clostridia bacterium]|nr:PHP domain-containing protein [Clostridia bacterium]
MERLAVDLHIHSALSPCGDDFMTPGNIVGMAVVNELDAIAITDHNSSENIPAAMAIAAEYGMIVIPGMELETV